MKFDKAHLSKSADHDPNYLASVVEVKNLRKHSNADKLQCTTVYGNNCIVAMDVKEGDKMIFFPIECAISIKLLSYANLLNKAPLNRDETSKGYFEEKGRVKAVRLRGEPSGGFLMKIAPFAEFFGHDPSDFEVGTDFDTVDVTHEVCRKYVVNKSKQGSVGGVKTDVLEKKDSIGRRLLPNQFRFHGSTSHLGRNIHLIKPDTIISISEKLHGCNAIYSKILTRKVLNKRQKFLTWLGEKMGIKFASADYEFVYSSRSVLKNRRDGEFTDDVWGVWAADMETKVPNGFTIYGELIGCNPNGGAVQKKYLYGYKLNESSFRAFRVTYTDPNGEVFELDKLSMDRLCHVYNIETVPYHFYGRAGDLFPVATHGVDTHLSGDGFDWWRERFLANLEAKFLDKPCQFCNDPKLLEEGKGPFVINEGVVLAIESSQDRTLLKFKSPIFCQGESAARDAGESNQEEES